MTADPTARPIPTYTDRVEAAKLEVENDRLRADLTAVRADLKQLRRTYRAAWADIERIAGQRDRALADRDAARADRDRLAAACAKIDRELTPHSHRAGMSPGHEAIAQALAATEWPGYRQGEGLATGGVIPAPAPEEAGRTGLPRKLESAVMALADRTIPAPTPTPDPAPNGAQETAQRVVDAAKAWRDAIRKSRVRFEHLGTLERALFTAVDALGEGSADD